MAHQLPPRPNLDHLRRQAKALLAALAEGDLDAIEVVRTHLPAAAGLTPQQVRSTPFRLADAQSAVARKTGFASWPQLARHVEQLRALEGEWAFASLEIDGNPMPPTALGGSKLLIDGDRFCTETNGVVYEGVFNIDVEVDPHHIDIDFATGPEAGNRNMGIYRLDGDDLRICLDMTGQSRPTAFTTTAGSGQAFEVLRRVVRARPEGVTGGSDSPVPATPGFEVTDSPTLRRLQGEWVAVALTVDGKSLPPAMLKSGRRTAQGNEVTVTFGGKVTIHALVRIEDDHVDYLHIGGPVCGATQAGVMKWEGNEVWFCMAPPGQPRPADFDCPVGSGRIVSRWRLPT